MDIEIVDNYIYTAELDLDLAGIKDSTKKLYDFVKLNLSNEKKDFTGQSTLTTSIFTKYNLLMYPLY